MKLTTFLMLIVMALAACSSGGASTSRDPTESAGSGSEASDSVTSTPVSTPQRSARSDESGIGKRVVLKLDAYEITNNELVDLILLEHYLGERNSETFELETAVFTTLAQVQSSELAFQIAPEHGVSVDPEVYVARVRTHLGLEDDNELIAGDREFDERFSELLESVGITDALYESYVRKGLTLEALQAQIESQDSATDFQRFMNDARTQVNLEIELNSDIAGWIDEQVQIRIQ